MYSARRSYALHGRMEEFMGEAMIEVMDQSNNMKTRSVLPPEIITIPFWRIVYYVFAIKDFSFAELNFIWVLIKYWHLNSWEVHVELSVACVWWSLYWKLYTIMCYFDGSNEEESPLSNTTKVHSLDQMVLSSEMEACSLNLHCFIWIYQIRVVWTTVTG